MSQLLKNGGWRGFGEFMSIREELCINGRKVQVCSYTTQLDENGLRRSRKYYEVRTEAKAVLLPAKVKTVRDAVAEATRLATAGEV